MAIAAAFFLVAPLASMFGIVANTAAFGPFHRQAAEKHHLMAKAVSDRVKDQVVQHTTQTWILNVAGECQVSTKLLCAKTWLGFTFSCGKAMLFVGNAPHKANLNELRQPSLLFHYKL